MPIIIPFGLETAEIRVLQEYRRRTSDTLPLATLVAIKHPADGGEPPVVSLVSKGYLVADDARENFSVTPKAKEFLAIDAKPEFEEEPKAPAAARAAAAAPAASAGSVPATAPTPAPAAAPAKAPATTPASAAAEPEAEGA